MSLLPRKMKQIELTILKRDMDAVVEFLGRRALIHLADEAEDSASENPAAGTPVPEDAAASKRIQENLDRLSSAAAWLGVTLPEEPLESSRLPGEAEEASAAALAGTVAALSGREQAAAGERRKLEETLTEARAFANLNAAFSDLDQLSYLTLRIGRLDTRRRDDLRQNLGDRALVIPLGEGGDRVLAAASRKGRFALDSELKKRNFVPITVPEGFKGIPGELLASLENRLAEADRELKDIDSRREKLKNEYAASLQALAGGFLAADITEKLKNRLRATENVYFLSGWVPAETIPALAKNLEELTRGRIAIRAYRPEELDRVNQGREKVPVAVRHNAFVNGFKNLVFSYGAPLYGTIDPTPFVAAAFTVLFGIMFGDLGQGLVLLLLGILAGKKGALSKLGKYAVPLRAVGVSSMVMGFLNCEFFANGKILSGPTRFLTGLVTGRPVDRILAIMPLHEEGGSVEKLFFFFAFTIGTGVLLNSAGLVINTVNQFFLRKYEKAVFSKTGLAGILFFWYVLFIAARFAAAKLKPESFSFSFRWYDAAVIIAALSGIFFGPVIWRVVSGKRPVFAEGVMTFAVEGFVELIETVSSYISNTVSFLRVGAFALSHAVLSYIVFRFSEEISVIAGGTFFSFFILVFGNAVIILLEGLIVAIQVVRLQYYEFFSKFFTEAGVEFSPFSFNKKRSET